MNPRLVTVAEIATMTGLPRLVVSKKLRDYRQTIAATKGNKQRRIGALYDLDNAVIKHLFALWGWDQRIKERGQDHGYEDKRAAESGNAHGETDLPDAGVVRGDVQKIVRRRTRSEIGK